MLSHDSSRVSRALLCILLCMTCACSVFSSTKSPDVLVTSFFLKDATLLETTAEFGIRIENDNPFPVEIDGSIHRVYLNDVFLGKGRDTSSFTIPRLGTLDRQISINVRNLTLIRKFEEIIHKPNIRYEIRSTFYRKNSIYGISSENKGEIRLNSYLQDMNAGRKTRPFHLAPNNR